MYLGILIFDCVVFEGLGLGVGFGLVFLVCLSGLFNIDICVVKDLNINGGGICIGGSGREVVGLYWFFVVVVFSLGLIVGLWLWFWEELFFFVGVLWYFVGGEEVLFFVVVVGGGGGREVMLLNVVFVGVFVVDNVGVWD